MQTSSWIRVDNIVVRGFDTAGDDKVAQISSSAP